MTVSTNIRIDEDIKKQATLLFKGLGLTLSEATNIFLHQAILHNGIPFKIEYPQNNDERKPARRLKKALREAEKMQKHPERYKTYNDPQELWQELGL